jgi:hypothetical protein
MATNTYVALDKITLGTATSTITFSSISGAYTDLIIVGNWGQSVDSESCLFRVGNGSVDTGTNYSATEVWGSGTAAGSQRTSTANGARITYSTGGGSAVTSNFALHLMNYANTTTNKSFLTRYNVPSSAYPGTGIFASLWRSTAAIDTVQLYLTGGNFLAGSTFSLYGIAAEGTTPAAKATGGAIYSDEDYYYHVFASTGVFTPSTSLTADVLVVAGGGGNVGRFGGGGGAGGLVYSASQSLTATSYTCTVGAGGSGGANGTNSNVTGGALSLTAAVGGGYGGNIGTVGASGGSGGGGGGYSNNTAGGATSGQGNAGGAGANLLRMGGGGGGAGAAGTAAATNAGNGGNGSLTYSSWGIATGTGQNVSGTVYYAGGGGGGSYQTAGEGVAGSGGFGGGGAGNTGSSSGTNGIVYTGGGAGGSGEGANVSIGGSGVVIVRYAK